MYRVNDTVVYGAQGVCRIADITKRDIGGMPMDYYVLKPVYDDNSTLFVPISNDKLTAKMRPDIFTGRNQGTDQIHA